MVKIEVQGLSKVAELLQSVPRVVQLRAHTKALSAGANVIADELERNTPVKPEETGGNSLDRGELRESVMIRLEVDQSGRGGQALIGFGKNGYVAYWLEYGHRLLSHGMKAIRRVIGNVSPRAFMRHSLEASAEKAIDAYCTAMRDELRSSGHVDDRAA